MKNNNPSSDELPEGLAVTCSRSRLASVFSKLTTKGFFALDAAERAVLNAHDAGTLLTLSDNTVVNGCRVGRFYQVSR